MPNDAESSNYAGTVRAGKDHIRVDAHLDAAYRGRNSAVEEGSIAAGILRSVLFCELNDGPQCWFVSTLNPRLLACRGFYPDLDAPTDKLKVPRLPGARAPRGHAVSLID